MPWDKQIVHNWFSLVSCPLHLSSSSQVYSVRFHPVWIKTLLIYNWITLFTSLYPLSFSINVPCLALATNVTNMQLLLIQYWMSHSSLIECDFILPNTILPLRYHGLSSATWCAEFFHVNFIPYEQEGDNTVSNTIYVFLMLSAHSLTSPHLYVMNV